MTSQNMNISFKRKQSIGTSGISGLSYSPSSHTMPAIFQHRDSYVHQRELENNFCSDLVCCGTQVRDLHELLHHYEEHHHAPIEEEPEPKEGVQEEEDEIMMDDIHLPTQPHELAALTSSPLLRKNLVVHDNNSSLPPSPILTTVNSQQHTEDILKQALPSLVNPANSNSSLQEYFRSEALYQTCDDGLDKPYKCPIKGCDKAYKNPNGLKYHQMHGHSEEESDAERDAQKPYMCTIGYCNKRYKNLNGLKYHIEHSHLAKLKQLPGALDQVNQINHFLNTAQEGGGPPY